jgi:hypothetical protein
MWALKLISLSLSEKYALGEWIFDSEISERPKRNKIAAWRKVHNEGFVIYAPPEERSGDLVLFNCI